MQKLALVILVALAISCGEKKQENTNSGIDGSKVFKTSCAICHGGDGKLGANGSKDLTLSAMNVTERIAIITAGKGTMPAQGSILTADEIKAVAEYTMTLK
jgi:cytochrome c6